jgi:hypothetical protein
VAVDVEAFFSAPASCAGSLAPLWMLVAFTASLSVASCAPFGFFLLPMMFGRVGYVQEQRAWNEQRDVHSMGTKTDSNCLEAGVLASRWWFQGQCCTLAQNPIICDCF